MCCPQCCSAGDFGSHEFCSGPMDGICCGKPFEDDQERIAWRLVPREEPKYIDQEYIKAQNAMYEKVDRVRRENEVKEKERRAKKEKRKDKEKGAGFKEDKGWKKE